MDHPKTKPDSSVSDALADEIEQWDIRRQDRILLELRRIKEVGWWIVLCLVIIAFFLIPN